MYRIGLFLLTNIAIIVVASISLRLLGVESILANNGVDLDLSSLLVFCAVFGFAGAFMSLLLSKFMAKRFTGIRLVSKPQTEQERWLLQSHSQKQGSKFFHLLSHKQSTHLKWPTLVRK